VPLCPGNEAGFSPEGPGDEDSEPPPGRVAVVYDDKKGTEGVWLDPKTHKTHAGEFALDATYDDHGNWTELRSWFTPADGGNRILTRSIKQTISYR